MSYTLEQKALAAISDHLWWRLPACKDGSEAWSLVSHDFTKVTLEDLQHPDAVYFIGPTPPPVLSELEGELLEALKEVFEQCDGYVPNTSKATWRKVAAVIQKAEGQA